MSFSTRIGAGGRAVLVGALAWAGACTPSDVDPDQFLSQERLAERRARSLEDGFCYDAPFVGTEVDSATIAQTLEAHERWLASGEVESEGARRANFCGAILDFRDIVGGDLSGVDFRWIEAQNITFADVDLTRAQFEGANLKHSTFFGSDLTRADFTAADLEFANLASDMRHARFFMARMVNASLRPVQGDSASFYGADLSGAVLDGGSLFGARLTGVRLTGARLDVDPGRAPDPSSLYGTVDLHRVRYQPVPRTLMELRDGADRVGLTQQSRDLTYAIRREARLDSPLPTRVAGYFFFEGPTQYGRRPERALMLIVAMIPPFALGYLVLILFGGRRSVITVDYQGRHGGRRRRVKIRPRSSRFALRGIAWNGWLALRISLASAFSVGQRGLDVGTWLNRLQARDYTFVTHGKARTLSGLQALLSFYLLSMWLVTLFRNPFA